MLCCITHVCARNGPVIRVYRQNDISTNMSIVNTIPELFIRFFLGRIK
jgi:hypothetical protein